MDLLRKFSIVILICAGVLIPAAGQAEVVEEIIAWVNGDIITQSDYVEEEKAMLAEIYRRFSGAELDEQVKRSRELLLQQMIDRKILVHHAVALGYDLDKMGDMFLEGFKEQQSITSDEEFAQALAAEGMTQKDVTTKLIEMYAPEEVLRFEVARRISVGDREVQAYYDENTEKFRVPGEVTFREIVLLASNDATKDQRRSEAEKLRDELLAGADFEALARERSEAGTKENGGLLGPVQQDDILPVLSQTAFSLPVESISDVMETPYGFNIIRVETRIDEHVKPLDEIHDQLRAFLENLKYQTELESFLKKARAESEWCIKPKHQNLIVGDAPTSCDKL